MASVEGCCSANEPSAQLSTADRISSLYSAVNESETPLPRQWSTKDKSSLLGLSQNSLTVHYKGGVSKNQKDAASVRAAFPIPSTCGIYYFEVTVVSKGRDGCMGIGLTASGVSLSRLPGWDKNSYGYHGDDGNSFCCSGTGQPYGPTFTTGDIIGCCVNLVDNTCFYTKNGISLGTAFTDLPRNLYPTIGLQTPGEIVEANFGQKEFAYNIDGYFEEWRKKIRDQINCVAVPNKTGEWQQALHRVVSTYLVHHGYCATAEAFLKSTGQSCSEQIASIQMRQKLQSLILAGRIGDAVSMTDELYPGLLDQNIDLLFALKCRQFIEIVNGTDGETIPTECMPPRLFHSMRHSNCSSRPGSASNTVHTSPHSGSPLPQKGSDGLSRVGAAVANGNHATNGAVINLSSTASIDKNSLNGESTRLSDCRLGADIDNDMDTSESGEERTSLNGVSPRRSCLNGSTVHGANDTNTSASNSDCDGEEIELDEAVMEVDQRSTNLTQQTAPTVMNSPDSISLLGDQLCRGNETAIRQLLQFGRYLHQLSQQLVDEHGVPLPAHQKTLRNVFSLLAYSDPWNSPVGYQLQPDQREAVCMALNSAILDRQGLPKQPPLELALAHVSQCVKLLSKSGISSCAFADITEFLH